MREDGDDTTALVFPWLFNPDGPLPTGPKKKKAPRVSCMPSMHRTFEVVVISERESARKREETTNRRREKRVLTGTTTPVGRGWGGWVLVREGEGRD